MINRAPSFDQDEIATHLVEFYTDLFSQQEIESPSFSMVDALQEEDRNMLVQI